MFDPHLMCPRSGDRDQTAKLVQERYELDTRVEEKLDLLNARAEASRDEGAIGNVYCATRKRLTGVRQEPAPKVTVRDYSRQDPILFNAEDRPTTVMGDLSQRMLHRIVGENRVVGNVTLDQHCPRNHWSAIQRSYSVSMSIPS